MGEGLAQMVGEPLLTAPASIFTACWRARQFDETSGDDVIGIHPDPLHGLDPRRLVSLCPPVDFGPSVAFPCSYVASFARSEPKFDVRRHAAEHTRAPLPPCSAPTRALAK
jgi:hypothetical protein